MTAHFPGADPEVAAVLKAILARERDGAAPVRLSPALWHTLADGGWLSFLAAAWDEHDPSGLLTALDAATQFGAELAPLPIVTGAGYVLPLLQELARESRPAAELVDALAAGDYIVSPVPVLDPDAGRYVAAERLSGARSGDRWRLSGTVRTVFDAIASGRVLASVALEGTAATALVSLDADRLDVSESDTIMTGTRVGRLVAHGLIVEDESLIRGDVDGAIHRAGTLWNLALDAYAVGIAAAALSRTVAYVRTREQFGVSIGSFQAVQLIVADMHIEVVAAASLLAQAALAVHADGADPLPDLVLASRLRSGDAATRATGLAIQAHGGAGFMWEVGIHHAYRAAMFSQARLADVGGLRRLLAVRLKARAGRASAFESTKGH